MWYFVGQGRLAGARFWFKPEETLTIGRLVAEDVFSVGSHDISVGRRHMTISVSKPTLETVGVRGQHSKLTVRDLSSKHGVFVNGARIEAAKDIEVVLEEEKTWKKQEDRHVAGRGYGGYVDLMIGESTSFRLERVDISLCSSGMVKQEKLGILESAVELDMKVEASDWVSGTSTHLIIGNNKQTAKMFLALAEGGYLVNINWIKELKAALNESWDTKGKRWNSVLETNYPAPVPAAFQDSSIHWEPIYARKVLFEQCRFISVRPATNSRLGDVVRSAGGTWSLEESKVARKLIKESLAETKVPVLLRPPGGDSVEKNNSEIDVLLKALNYRWVNEDEIGKAILYASVDIYCNPKYVGELPALSNVETAPPSQSTSSFMGSMVSVPAFAPSFHTNRDLNIVGRTEESPQVIQDHDEPELLSFDSLSQIMPVRSRKPYRSAPAPLPPKADVIVLDGPSKPLPSMVSDKPAKKKPRTDRRALFFDGLDDDDEMMMEPPPANEAPALEKYTTPPLPKPSVVAVSRNQSSLQIPVPVAWPERIALDVDQEREPATSGETLSETTTVCPSRQETTLVETPSAADQIPIDLQEVVAPEATKAEPVLPQALSSLASGSGVSGKKKKSSAFDAVREDMVALKLDAKVGRQKDNLDEKERIRRIEAQRQAEKSKYLDHGLMQSERSDALLAKSKRRKLAEHDSSQASQSLEGGQSQVIPEDASAQISVPSLGRSSSIQILDDTERENWPDRWKLLPNFKARTTVDPVLQEKWKNVPNFKSFRKSTLPGPGRRIEPSQPKPLFLDGELVVKKEEKLEKIGRYLKREESEVAMPPPKPRRKVSEKQRAREDVALLLADD